MKKLAPSVRRFALALTAVLLALPPAAAQQALPLPPGDGPPPSAAELVAAASAAAWPEAHWLVVRDHSVNRVDERGVTVVESEILYKVLDAEGCRELAVLRWGYDPQSSEVTVREVNVLRGDERIPVDVSAVLDLPAPQAAIYWSDRVMLLQLPRLEPGDGIQVGSSRRGFTYALLDGAAAGPDDDRFVPPMPGEYFDVVLFQGEAPILDKRYELHLPAAKRLHSEVYNGALFSSTTYDATSTVYAWWGRDLAPAPLERRQPDDSDVVTKVVLATVESWEAKSRWFFDINNGQFDTTPAIDAKVEEVLEAAGAADGSDEAKAEALVHWVAQNIRYSGQTMGRGEGFILHPGTMIFEQRSGVCKDIAGMLVTMMRAAGITANPAMTMAGSRIEEVPADQFNHCVVARRDGDSWVMYDPTWVPYNNDIWSKLETEQHYLVGSTAGEPLRRIRYSPPAESPLIARHRARLAADGSLRGTIRLEASGASDGRLRRLVYGTPARRLKARMEELLAEVGDGVAVERIDHHPVDDFSGDMWLELDYSAPALALPVAGGLELSSPLLAFLASDRSLFGAAAERWPDTRTSDLMLWMTQLVEGHESIELPAGAEVTAAPEAVAVDETYAAFSASQRSSGGRLEIELRGELKRRQIPPAGYAGFAAAMKAAHEWADAVFHVQLEGGAS